MRPNIPALTSLRFFVALVVVFFHYNLVRPLSPLSLGDFGYRAVTDRCAVADLHRTMLHLLGLDHGKLAYQHNGRQERLTDVYQPRLLQALLR